MDSTRDTIPTMLRQAASQLENRLTYIQYLEHSNRVMRHLLWRAWKNRNDMTTEEWSELLYSEFAGPERWHEYTEAPPL